jgi:ligand-binding sensor domain-containing protein
VQSVCQSRQGGLWIGYNDELIDHYQDGKLQHFNSFSTERERQGLQVQSVLEDRSGRVWAGVLRTTGGPGLFLRQEDRFLPVPVQAPALYSTIPVLFQDRRGVVWAGTQQGLVRSDDRGWRVFGTREHLSSQKILSLAEDREGNLWIGTQGGGLNCLRDGVFSAFRKQPKDGLPSDDVYALLVDTNNVLWAGTAAGLARYRQGAWTRYTTADGLTSNKINYLLEDDLEGLGRFRRRKDNFHSMPHLRQIGRAAHSRVHRRFPAWPLPHL